MISLAYLFIFIFGLIIGSFLNCVIFRLEKEESFLKGRSYCPNCKHALSWLDLIPVFSYLLLKGKCRYCKEKISFQYPLVELATGIVFVFLFHYLILDGQANFQILNLSYYFAIFSLLIIIFVVDLKHYIIPDPAVYSAILISGLWQLAFRVIPSPHILSPIYSAFGAALFFLAIVLVSKGKWMGIGDIKLAFFMGLFLGWPNILAALFLSFFLGSIIGIILMAFKKKGFKSEIPFAPFLIAGTFIAFFGGSQIIDWYLNFISGKIL